MPRFYSRTTNTTNQMPRSMNRKLCPPTLDVVIIYDDESYFHFKHDEIAGNCGFTQITREIPHSELNKNQKQSLLKMS